MYPFMFTAVKQRYRIYNLNCMYNSDHYTIFVLLTLTGASRKKINWFASTWLKQYAYYNN